MKTIQKKQEKAAPLEVKNGWIVRGNRVMTTGSYQLKERFTSGIRQLEGTAVNSGDGTESAPHIVSVSFSGIRSEVLLHSLEMEQIYVSAGSACSSNKPAVSSTLTAIGVKKEFLDSTLRFSFGTFTTPEEIDYTLEALARLLPKLRKYARM